MDTLFTQIMSQMPETLKARLAHHSVNKVASAMYGVESIDFGTASRIIGEKLAARRAVNREINLGLKALELLEK